jgi:hypothetical protein
MSNILLSEQNKELLWNILSSNKAFVSIPESMFPNIKAIFENAIIKVNSQNKELVSSNYRTGDSKNIITQLNKIILQNIMLDINNFKKSLLTPIDIKDVYKNEKSEEFEKEFLQKKVSFTNLITKKVPETIDFRDTKDLPLENNSMNELLERIQKERNTILPLPQKLEVVDLDKFDTPSINEENVNNLEKATINNLEKATINNLEKATINNDTTKTKIMNIEDLISSLATNTNANSTHNSVKKFIAQENNGEFNLNINIKLDFLNKQLEKVLNNQKLIMTKLNI